MHLFDCLHGVRHLLTGLSGNDMLLHQELEGVDIRNCLRTRCQFHQNFTGAFFVRKQIWKLFSIYVWLCDFWRQKFVQKTQVKH